MPSALEPKGKSLQLQMRRKVGPLRVLAAKIRDLRFRARIVYAELPVFEIVPLSEEARSVFHPMMRESVWRAASRFQVGKDGAFLAACGQAPGTISALLAVDPLKKDVQQKVTSENANR
jgi:hypothetical protein